MHLLYSAADSGGLDYGIADAVGTNPLGPFTRRAENPLLHALPQRGVFAPGHHSITTDADGNLIAFYHSRLAPEPGVRRIRSTPVSFDEAGNIVFRRN